MSALLLCLLAFTDLSGVWTLKEDTPGGPVESRLELLQEKTKLLGFVEGHPLLQGRNRVEGKAKGDRVQFDIITRMDDMEFVLIFDGRLSDDATISGSVRVPGRKRWNFTAKRN